MSRIILLTGALLTCVLFQFFSSNKSGDVRELNNIMLNTDTIKNLHDPEVVEYYYSNLDTLENSVSYGTPREGHLKNGKIIPFYSDNWGYYSKYSYMKGRAYVNHRLKNLLVATYEKLKEKFPERTFKVMECSYEAGGEISGHRTHRNGLSVDFMTPLMKDSVPYYGLDNLGNKHYKLEFDDNGTLKSDTTVNIDFEMMAQHILVLDDLSREHGLKVKKVIWKMELKDDFYKSSGGKEVRRRGIYLTMKLPDRVNRSHDDHYHIDFEVLN